MLKINKKALGHLERTYPGIGDSIRAREAEALPACSRCGSVDTASVGCGLVGRSINLAAATTKFKLVANSFKPGEYFCNACDKFFN